MGIRLSSEYLCKIAKARPPPCILPRKLRMYRFFVPVRLIITVKRFERNPKVKHYKGAIFIMNFFSDRYKKLRIGLSLLSKID